MQKPNNIHFVGIKGVGMTPLAVIAKEAGIIVTGSDIADGFITDAMLASSGIVPFVGFDKAHIGQADLVITTGAHGGYDNVEVVAAKSRGIPVLTQGQAVGEFMQGNIVGKEHLFGISVGGTHGKTTTTAMIATVLEKAGKNPSWVIGTSQVKPIGFSGHFGLGNYFIAEADEYANEPTHDKTPKMLLQHPSIAVITNIEHDHPDLYETIDSVREAFLRFAQNLPSNGILITCGDDSQVQQMLEDFHGNVLTYGFGAKNTAVIKNIQKNKHGIMWDVVFQSTTATLSLALPGEHNALNATAAYIVGTLRGIPVEQIQKALLLFGGTKRRMEYVGQLESGALLYDDYAHHPTEIEKTLTAIREKYPNKKIVCVFQPHTYSRTKLLFDQFIDSLALADEVILSDIYSSKREAFDSSVSSAMLVQKLSLKTHATLARTLADVVKYIDQHHYGLDTVIMTMGAGDIYTVANQIVEHSGAPKIS